MTQKSQDNLTLDEQRYQEGQELARKFIAAGGDLMQDPPRSNEACENGFADTLADQRRSLNNKSKP